MLIDWVTARIPLDDLSPEARQAALGAGDLIQRFCPATGEVVYTTSAWDSIRSDSHQLAMRVTGDLWVQGSPARCMGEGDTVFGSGASAALDLVGCVQRMVDFITGRLGVTLPPAAQWKVTRVDVTGNLMLESVAEVRSALSILRGTEGGRYRVSAQAGDTVYWSSKSVLRKGKAYAKGPHLRHLMKQKSYSGRQYTEAEILNAEKLLRLELTLGREWFARLEKHWSELQAVDLKQEWDDYFGRMIGDAEMANDDMTLRERIEQVAPTPGQGKAAFGMWCMIQSHGWERTRDLTTSRTWYRNLKILRAAGLGDADISRGEVVQLRKRVLEAALVTSWAQLAA